MATRLENFDIWVQMLPSPEHYNGMPSVLWFTQGEIRAAVTGFVMGVASGTYYTPIHASQIPLMKEEPFCRDVDLLAELANRGYKLPKNFDPVIFAYHPRDEQHSLEHIVVWGDAQTAADIMYYRFNMRRLDKKQEEK